MRTAIYVDGFNLYYWMKRSPYRWVDLKALASNAIARPDKKHDIVAVKYFTARVSDRAGGVPWYRMQASRYMKDACAAAKTEPPAGGEEETAVVRARAFEHHELPARFSGSSEAVAAGLFESVT